MFELPFTITARVKSRDSVSFIAERNGQQLAVIRYTVGDAKKRAQSAEKWLANKSLFPKKPKPTRAAREAIEQALESAELRAVKALEEQEEAKAVEAMRVNDARIEELAAQYDSPNQRTRPNINRALANYADENVIVELAWNLEAAAPDFIVYDRRAAVISRAVEVDTINGTIVLPEIGECTVTPGTPIDGAIFLPTDVDVSGFDGAALRKSVRAFVHRYVELSHVAENVVVEYVLFSWVHDAFDELPYLAFRTADCGRGKSRALETTGAICYRPMFCGGGSSAAATLRLLDKLCGTLVADEFDQTADTELAGDVTRILNQGFQRNRPLFKCVGDNNEPRAFRCFGPKLFALRKGFGDDATESRVVSVCMMQRTRSDIPLNLPRAMFDAEALALRNKLLAWRFANLGRIQINSELRRPDLEDRLNQIGLPLFSVAADDDSRRQIAEALRGQQIAIADDRADTLPGLVLRVALQVHVDGIVRPKDIADEINRKRAQEQGLLDHGQPDVTKLRKPMQAFTIGPILSKTLELPKAGRDSVGVFYRMDSARLRQLKERYAISDDRDAPLSVEPAQPTTLHTQNREDVETRVSDSTNAESVDPVGRVGFSIPDGFPPNEWADRLDGLANLCQATKPDQAAAFQADAAAIRAKFPTEGT